MLRSTSKRAPQAASKENAAVGAMRCEVLDSLRGLALCNMIAYHACWDAVHLFNVDLPWFRSPGAYIWQQSICWSFIFLSGFCWPLSRRPLRRGVSTLLAGALVSAVTAIALPKHRVLFGVLTLLGSCALFLLPLEKMLRRLPPLAGFCLASLLFCLTRNVSRGAFGFEAWDLAKLPAYLYQNCYTAYFGFPPPGFSSSDYFPLLPWFFLFLSGYFAARGAAPRRLLWRAPAPGPKILQKLGQRSLLVYLLHQPLLYTILYFIFA